MIEFLNAISHGNAYVQSKGLRFYIMTFQLRRVSVLIKDWDRILCRYTPKEWVTSILNTIDHDTSYLGFSEYVSYASWVQRMHPETVEVQRQKTWRRHPPQGRRDIMLKGQSRQDKLCCPTREYLWYRTRQGMEYVGWEIGHACNMGNSETYGISFSSTPVKRNVRSS